MSLGLDPVATILDELCPVQLDRFTYPLACLCRYHDCRFRTELSSTVGHGQSSVDPRPTDKPDIVPSSLDFSIAKVPYAPVVDS